jgi:hypothetical protein
LRGNAHRPRESKDWREKDLGTKKGSAHAAQKPVSSSPYHIQASHVAGTSAATIVEGLGGVSERALESSERTK